MNSDEEYLDNLLKTALNPNGENTPENMDSFEEDINANQVSFGMEEIDKIIINDVNDPIEITPLDDNPNRQLTSEEIATLFSGANNDNNIEIDSKTDDFNEEMEFDLDSLENIDDLLGLRDKSSMNSSNEIDLTNSMDSIDQNLDITDIIDNMEENDDEDLAEINELLKKSDNSEMVEEDELLSLLEEANTNLNFNEEATPVIDMSENIDDTNKENKKERKKLFAKTDRNKTKKEKAIESELSIDNKDEKTGIFQRMFHALTIEVEDEKISNVDVEPINKKKHSKNKKKSKNKPNAASNEEILDDLEKEDLQKKLLKGKAKKEKKPKKVKKEKKIGLVEDTGKKLPKKMVMSILILCISILAVCYLLVSVIPPMIAKQSARRTFYNGEFENTYKKLQSLELNESDTILYKKAEILTQLKHKNDASIAYMYVNSKDKALNALLEGIIYYKEMESSIVKLEINEQAMELYQIILKNLKDTFNITEEDALVFIDLDNVSYTDKIHLLANDKIAADHINVSNNSIQQDDKTEILDGELDE